MVLEAHVSYCSVQWSPPARLSVIHCPSASRLGHRNGGGWGPRIAQFDYHTKIAAATQPVWAWRVEPHTKWLRWKPVGIHRGTLVWIPASGFIRVTGQGSRSKEISKSDAQGKSRLNSVWICARLESARSCEHGFCSKSGQATRWLEAQITDLFDEASGGQYFREMISLSAEAGLPVHAMSPSQHQSARCARASHRAASAVFREPGVSLPPKRHHNQHFVTE